MKKNQKGSTAIIVLLIVILLAGGIYLGLKSGKIPLKISMNSPVATNIPSLQPSPESPVDTSNWKNYENSELGYSIKYPNNYSLCNEQAVTGTNFYTSLYASTLDCKKDTFQVVPDVLITVAENSNIDRSSYTKEDPCIRVEQSTVNIGGFEGVQYKQFLLPTNQQCNLESPGFKGPVSNNVLLVRKNKTYIINVQDWDGTLNFGNSGMDILSTFKFTN